MTQVTGTIDSTDTRKTSEEHRRLRALWAYRGFGTGIAIGILHSLIAFGFVRWRVFPFGVVNAFVYYPLFLAFVGYHRAPVPRDGKLSWRRLRFGTRTLMLLIAYVAVLCAIGVLTAPIGRNAARYHGKSTSSQEMADVFDGIAKKAEVEGPVRLRNAEQLRAGEIASGIMPEQKEFLRSLDMTASPDYRKERYELIAAGEERMGRLDQRNATVMRALTEYHQRLAVKYREAARRPWLPVEPDPPMPPTQ